MACTAFETMEAESWQVIKVGSRLNLPRVVISDQAKSVHRNEAIRAWFTGDEPRGSYMYTDIRNTETYSGFQKWEKGVYFFTDANTAFAFKVRFG